MTNWCKHAVKRGIDDIKIHCKHEEAKGFLAKRRCIFWRWCAKEGCVKWDVAHKGCKYYESR